MSGVRNVEAWVTAYGAVTGAGDERAWRALWLEGRSAVRAFEGPEEGLPPGYGAPVAFSAKELRGLPGGRGLRPGTMTASTFLSSCAVGRALHNAELVDPSADADELADRRGVYIGTYTHFPKLKKHVKLVHVMGNTEVGQSGHYAIDDHRIMAGMKGFTGFDFLKLMNNMPTAHGAIQANARGPANTFLGHGSVGLQVVGKAHDALCLGLADQMVVGASGPGTLEGLCLIHASQGVLAQAGERPEGAARPLDEDATGIVPGDGGAAFVIETKESMSRRGAKPLARVAASRDLFVAPRGPRGPWEDSRGLERLLQATLEDAGWEPADVDYLLAAGLGLPELDKLEAQAYGQVFGAALGDLSIGVHTGVSGFTEAAHGALGMVAALQAMDDGRVPPQVNLGRPWGPLSSMTLHASPASRDVRRALVVSLSAEGTMAAVALERA